MKSFLLFLMLMLFLFSGCSILSTTDEPTIVMSAPGPIPKERPVQSAEGALWNEVSGWNDMYNYSNRRFVGDTIKMKLEDRLKNKMLAAIPKENPPPPSAANAGAEANAAPERGIASTPNGEKPEEIKWEMSNVDLTIMEVRPRDTFQVSARQKVKNGKKEHTIEMVAVVREKDIEQGDEINSDLLLNPVIRVQTGDVRPQ